MRTSVDASAFIGRWWFARRNSLSPACYSIHWFQAPLGVCTKHLSGLLIGALLPLRVPETHLLPHPSIQYRPGLDRPVSLGLERGAEIEGVALIGASRMLGGEVEIESSATATRNAPGSGLVSGAACTDLRVSRRLLGLALPLVPVRTRCQLCVSAHWTACFVREFDLAEYDLLERGGGAR